MRFASPQPKRQPQWTCGDCGSSNAASNTRCRNCQYPPADKPRPTDNENKKGGGS
jgi:ribosomal protein L40E